MNWPERHIHLSPVILEILERGRYPGIAKGEVPFILGIECGTVSKAIHVSVFESYCLIDFGVVDHMPLVDGRRPGKHEYVVAPAGDNLTRRPLVDFFYRDVVHD